MRISEFIGKRVPYRRTSDRKSPMAVGVESTARYDELVSVDWMQMQTRSNFRGWSEMVDEVTRCLAMVTTVCHKAKFKHDRLRHFFWYSAVPEKQQVNDSQAPVDVSGTSGHCDNTCWFKFQLLCQSVLCAARHHTWWMCIPVSMTTGRSHLRSCSRRDLRIPCCRLSRYGSPSFAVSGRTAWNSLSTAVQDLSSSHSCFCSRLKTELFSGAYGTFVIALAIRMGKDKHPYWTELNWTYQCTIFNRDSGWCDLAFIRQECNVDLLQWLYELCRWWLAQLVEQLIWACCKLYAQRNITNAAK